MRRLLWIDCVSALVAGTLLLALSGWLDGLLGLPLWFVVGEGLVNLAYGTFSFSLARKPMPKQTQITGLAVANGMWAALCLALAVALFGKVTPLGTIHFAIGALYVGTLGVLEWRHRDALSAP